MDDDRSAALTHYDERLAAVNAMLEASIAAYHHEEGTSCPPAGTVKAVTMNDTHISVTFPVAGRDHPEQLGISVKDEDTEISEHHIKRIVDRASMWDRWHLRINALDADLKIELDRLIKNTDITVDSINLMSISGSKNSINVSYFVDVKQLNGALRQTLARWSMQWNEDDQGIAEWKLRENATLLPTQRRRARMLRQSAGKPQITVEGSLVAKIMQMPNPQAKRVLWKKLFGAAHGETGTKVPWNGITKIEAIESRIIATIPLTNAARIRGDVITVKGANFPEAIMAALSGRAATAALEHPLLVERTIKSARNRKGHIVIELEPADMKWDDMKHMMDGEN